MRRFRRTNAKWLPDLQHEMTLDLENENSQTNQLDKSNWTLPVQESKLDKSPEFEAKPAEIQDESIDSKKLNFYKDGKQEMSSKRQRISLDLDIQGDFDTKKLEESMASIIQKQLPSIRQ